MKRGVQRAKIKIQKRTREAQAGWRIVKKNLSYDNEDNDKKR